MVVFEQSNLGHVTPGCIESCMYSKEMLERYRHVRNRRGTRRPSHETWISVHFRWGDVGSNMNHSLSRPRDIDWRTGADLESFVHTVSQAEGIAVAMGRQTKLFFFTEASHGREDDFSSVVKKFPNISFHTNSGQWLQALDLMSLSAILIGGRSAFFHAAKNLCDDCFTVSLPENVMQKFPEQKQRSCSPQG